MSIELNIDGLVGPTHNYGGMSVGNLASQKNHGLTSNPKAAALQGLNKMRKMVELGLQQAVMPPQERPYLSGLRRLGFSGSNEQIIEKAWKSSPILLNNYMSASSMWTANAATISPSADTHDKRVHLTPANLSSMPHRAIEGPQAQRLLSKLFSDENLFVIHDPLPMNSPFGDEGAANHNRLSLSHASKGIEIFVHGRTAFSNNNSTPLFPARQTLEASMGVARHHGLDERQTLHVIQSEKAINAGAFHNDVVCVTNGCVLLFHEYAFEDTAGLKNALAGPSRDLGMDLHFIEASNKTFPISDAISSYFFNSQLLTLPDGSMTLLLPSDAEENTASKAFADFCLASDNPITQTIFMDLRQSMRNGGGPACLRLRVELTQAELQGMHQPALLDLDKISTLEDWVARHYRDALAPDDLRDPQLMRESFTALDELSQILELGSVYEFQN